MAMPDRKFVWMWTIFLAFFVVVFILIETAALMTGGTTLSRYTWEVSQAWPLLPFVLGALVGGLAVHFWWHWTPPGSREDAG